MSSRFSISSGARRAPGTLCFAGALLVLSCLPAPASWAQDMSGLETRLTELLAQISDLARQKRFDEAIPYAEEALTLVREVIGEENDTYAALLFVLAGLYENAGRYDKAIPIYGRTASVAGSVHGDESPEYLRAVDSLAGLYEKMGRLAEAEELYVALLEIRRALFGEEHPDCVASQSTLGNLYRSMGRYADAEPLLTQALNVQIRLRGEDSRGYGLVATNLALLYHAQGRYAEAEPLYTAVLDLARRSAGSDPLFLATALNNLALFYKDQGRLVEAVSLLEAALEQVAAAHGEGTVFYTRIVGSLGGVYHDIGRLIQARDLLERALISAARTSGTESPGYAVWQSNLATVLMRMGESAAAESLLVSAASLQERLLGEDHPERLTLLGNLSAAYQSRGAYQEAENLLLDVLRRVRVVKGGRHPDAALWTGHLASLYLATGRYREALSLLRDVLDIQQGAYGEREPAVVASAFHNLALAYMALGRYEEAEQAELRAVATYRALGEDHPDLALSYAALALLYTEVGRYAEAEPFHRRAAEAQRAHSGTASRSYALSLNNLALFYSKLGRYEEAVPLAEEAVATLAAAVGEAHPDYPTAVSALALTYDRAGRSAEAEVLYERAVRLRREALGPLHPDYALALNNLAAIYVDGGRYSEAISLLEEAIAAWKAALGEQHNMLALAYANLAGAYNGAGRLEETEAMLRASLQQRLAIFGPAHPGSATSLGYLGGFLARLGRHDEALLLLRRALDAEDASLRQVFSFSSEAEMRSYLATADDTYRGLLTLAWLDPSPQHVAVALEAVRRRKGVLFETLADYRRFQLALRSDPEVRRTAEDLRGLRQHLADLQLDPPAAFSADARRTYLDSLSRQINSYQAQLNRLVGRRVGGRDAEVRADAPQPVVALAPGAATIEIVRFRPAWFSAPDAEERLTDRYVAFVLRDTSRVMVDLGPAAALDDATAAFGVAMDQARREFGRGEDEAYLEEEIQDHGRSLYRLLFAPLLPALGDVRILHFSLDGELHRLPLGALVAEGGAYLAEHYSISYLNSTRDLHRPAVPAAGGTVVLAGPDFDLSAGARVAPAEAAGSAAPEHRLSRSVRGLSWDPLPGAAAEAADIRQMLSGSSFGPVVVFEEQEAREEVLKELRAPRVLHVATHGFFLENQAEEVGDLQEPASGFGAAQGQARLRTSENPLMRSGLVLAGANRLGEHEAGEEDGWLTAEEIALLELDGTELVVLSACETGLGDLEVGEGVHGLRRAFAYAGAASLVTTLFKVPDEEARELMRGFYGELLEGGTKAEALTKAQRQMIERRRAEQGAAHPFFWASFILIGNPD